MALFHQHRNNANRYDYDHTSCGWASLCLASKMRATAILPFDRRRPPGVSSMSQVFQFGERLPEYSVPVLNEREARAGAGILFFVAMIAFMNAWLTGDVSPTKIIVIGFFICLLYTSPSPRDGL